MTAVAVVAVVSSCAAGSVGFFPASAATPKPSVARPQATPKPAPKALVSTPTTFYFAEGFTGAGFTESLALFMPSTTGNASVDYFTEAGPVPTTTVAAQAGKVSLVDVNAAVGAGHQVSARVTLPGNGVAERTIHFDTGTWHGSTDIVGVAAPATDWYFAEGSTLSVFSEFLTLQNPSTSPNPVTLNYFTDTGATPTKTLTLPAQSRTTVEVFNGATANATACTPNGPGANCGVGAGIGGVSVRVTAQAPIIAERPFYVNGYSFGDGVIRDGHDAFGANAPATSWNFAEGTTLPGFKEYLTLQNPGSLDATTSLHYFTNSGQAPVKGLTVPAHSRVTVEVFHGSITSDAHCTAGANGTCGVGGGIGGVSTQVDSDRPIVAERPMYMVQDFGTGSVAGAHDVVGALSLGRLFGFAGSTTVAGQNDYLTIQNPSTSGSSITVTYFTPSTTNPIVQKSFIVPATTRVTVEVFRGNLTTDQHCSPTLGTCGVGAGVGPMGIVLSSDQPVLVEKPTYSSNAAAYGATDTQAYPIAPEPPPDPGTVAPPVNPSVATDLASASAFLYTGPNPSQTGVAPGTIQPLRVSVLRGRVLTRDGQPLAGAALSVLGHPEYGTTLSRVDGMYDMAVNGGGDLTVNYAKDGFLQAQRQVSAAWQNFAPLPDVALIPVDSQVTPVDLTSPTPVQVARGTTITDADGTRKATLLIPQGTQATMQLPSGSTQPLSTLHIRATEYTVGPNGMKSMPAELPLTSGFTYALELTADEAMAAGATDLRFNHPLPFYLENFLAFPVGQAVPSGFYDRKRGQWVPSDNGLVIKILSITGGLADLDIDGTGVPASASALTAVGITDAERGQLASLYAAGASLWRIPMTHFTPWDCNWPVGPPADARPPQQPDPRSGGRPTDNDCRHAGSIIGCENQLLEEATAVVGTPFNLHYASDRVPGRARTIAIPLSGATVPASLKRIQLEIDVAGQHFSQSLPPTPNQTANFTWDGKDAYGRALQGSQPISGRTGYVYTPVYMTPAQQRNAFATFGDSLSGVRARQEVTIWQNWQSSIGTIDARGIGLGGWSLSQHHTYDVVGRILYLGDGRQRHADPTAGVISTLAGDGGACIQAFYPCGDGGPASHAQLTPFAITTGPDGSVYVFDNSFRLRRIAPDGIIQTIGGIAGQGGYGGDGGPATQAKFGFIAAMGLAIGADGSIYLAEQSNHRIRRIAPDGIVTTVAGNGTQGFAGDGGPATAAAINYPGSVAVAPDGSFYIADYGNQVVRRVGPDGIITTVAGNGINDATGDGGPARQAALSNPGGVDVGPDGALYINTQCGSVIRRVGTDGVITTIWTTHIPGPATCAPTVRATVDGSLLASRDDSNTNRIERRGPDGSVVPVAGTGATGFNGDGGLALQTTLWQPTGVAVGADRAIYIADQQNNRVRRVSPSLPGLAFTDFVVSSEDGAEVYVFNSSGRHLRTLDTLTRAIRYQFSYDAAGRLSLVTDGYGNQTMIERDAVGNPTAIVAPGGQRTSLAVDANGFLNRIADPANDAILLTSTAGGLLTAMTDPRTNTHHFSYDSAGRLVGDQDPAGGSKTLTRTETPTGFTVAVTTGLSRTWTHTLERQPDGGLRNVRTDPNGAQTVAVTFPDGTETITYPDGTVQTLKRSADSRFGMQAPVLRTETIALPGGLIETVAAQRTPTLSDPTNPLSLSALTATVTVNGRTSTAIFDGTARTITQTTPVGRQAVTSLDTLGRVVQVVPSTGVAPIMRTFDSHGRLASTSQGTQSWTLAYDAQNRLTSVTDAAGNKVSYIYDAADRLTKTTLPGGESYQFAYDANGNRTQVTMPSAQTHQLSYTPVDLLSGYTPPGGSASTFGYDADRQLVSQALVGHGTEALTYDTGGRPASRTYAEASVAFKYGIGDQSARVADVSRTLAGALAGQDVAFGYSGPLMKSATWSSGSVGAFTYAYDNNFFLTGSTLTSGTDAVSTTLTRDSDGLLTGMGTFALTRGGPGGALSQMTDSKLNLSLAYNNLARNISRTETVNAASVYSAQLTYDAEGRITGKNETVNGSTHSYAYQYDTDGQLTKVTRDTTVEEQYSYDVNGNRASRQLGSASAETAAYDAQDRLTQRGGITYQFDADGFLKQRGSDTFTYSTRGELLSATIGSQTITYAYDGLGRRVTRADAGGTTQYLYGNPGNPLQVTQVRSAAGLLSTLSYDDAGLLVAIDRGSNRYYVATDQLGSPRVVSDATGTAVKVLDYDAFGDQIADSNPSFDMPIGFAGGLSDGVTLLVHFGFRDYEPASGRWTARDPGLFSGGQGNLYAYVANDPIGKRDPTGLFCIGGSFYSGVGTGLSLCISDQGLSVCEEFGFGYGGGITVDPFGGLAAAGNDLVAKVGVSCGPLNLSAGVSLNHCGDFGASASGNLSAGPLSVGLDASGDTTFGPTGESGPISGEIDSQGHVVGALKVESSSGSLKPSGFNGGCSIGGKIAGQFCQRFGG